MTEWGVVGVIVALVGLVTGLVKPMISLTQSITKLTVMMEQFAADFGELTAKNSSGHDKLWRKNEEHDHTLQDHEKRIVILEERGQS